MNTQFRLLTALLLGTVIQSAVAHDPAEHATEAAEKSAAPDCTAMQNMDHSKMDMSDPVAQAMMSQCSEPMDHGDMSDMNMDSSEASDAASDDHGSH